MTHVVAAGDAMEFVLDPRQLDMQSSCLDLRHASGSCTFCESALTHGRYRLTLMCSVMFRHR